MFTQAAAAIIIWYQKTLSPDHGLFKARYPDGFCRFEPSCSQYTLEAVKTYGFTRGFLMGAWRVIRCNPWSKGGFDPIIKFNERTSKNSAFKAAL